jgi:hypothetical protein
LKEAHESHIDRRTCAKVKEVFGRKRPTPSFCAHTLGNLIGYR